MSKQLFWVCYLLLMTAIVLLPVIRNIYSHIKYNMSFAEHDKYIIDKFCENDTCRYMSKPMFFVRITAVFCMPASIIFVYYATFIGHHIFGMHMLLLLIAITFILNISTVYVYMALLYERCVMTSTSMLIRSRETKYKFYTILLNDIAEYQSWRLLYGMEKVYLITKDKRRFSLLIIDNNEEMIAVLKKFSDVLINDLVNTFPINKRM